MASSRSTSPSHLFAIGGAPQTGESVEVEHLQLDFVDAPGYAGRQAIVVWASETPRSAIISTGMCGVIFLCLTSKARFWAAP
jgi:hypothetical protein